MHSLEPREAIQKYLESRSNEVSEATLQTHESRLSFFIEWCDERGINDVSELDGLDCHEYKTWRWEQGDPSKVTMKSQIDTFRRAIRFLTNISAVEDGLDEKIQSPSLDKDEDVRNEMLDPDVAAEILNYLDTYEHATRDHVIMLLIYRGLLRRGAVRAIDTDDVTTSEDGDPVIRMEHRPDTGTPLKNKESANRFLAVKPGVQAVLNRYEEHHRHDVKDDFNRSPLVTSKHGRPHVSTIASTAYAITRPCTVTNECPHGRDIGDCRAAKNRNQAHHCPSSKGPHAIRRGAITHWLTKDTPQRVVSDRSSTSVDVLSDVYDQRDEATKAEQRRDYLID